MRSLRHYFVLMLCLCALSLAMATHAQAEWPATGLPIATGPTIQTLQTLVPDDAGGAYVLWSTGTGVRSRMQRISADGSPAIGWGPSGVALTPYTLLGATRDGAGGLYMLCSGPKWVDLGPAFSYGRRVYAYHYGPDGQLAASWPDTGVVVWSETYPIMDDYGLKELRPIGAYPDGSGGAHFVLRWERAYANAGYYFLNVRPGRTATLWNSWANAAGNTRLSLAEDGLGGLVCLKTDESYVEAFGYSGTSGFTSPRSLATGSFWWADGLALRLSPGSDMLLSWMEENQTQTMQLRTDRALQSLSGWPAPGVRSAYTPLASDEQGGALAKVLVDGVWRVQRLDVSSSPPVGLWPAAQLPSLRAGSWGIVYGDFIADGEGGFYEALSESGLRAFHIGLDGERSPSWPVDGRVLSTHASYDWNRLPLTGNHVTIRTEPGVAFVAWSEVNGTDQDVYLQRLADFDPVPTAVSHASAQLLADRVVLDWTLAAVDEALTVERRSADGAWSTLGPPQEIAPGRWRYEDRDVRAGDALAYQLLASGERLAGSELSVTVPLAPRLTLRGFVTNPSASDGVVEFALPDAGAARLELLDVAGRVLARREVGTLGAGTHRVALAEGLTLRPGLVFARLVRGDQVRIARATLLR